MSFTRLPLKRFVATRAATALSRCISSKSPSSWQVLAGATALAGAGGAALQLRSSAHCEQASWPLDTPMDVRRGLTKASDVNFPLRWGIMGAGNISSDWARSLRDIPGAKLMAVAARSKEKAAEFAAEHKVQKVFSNYAEMVADPDVDIVYVGTITPLHKEHALLAIAAGKHVLCEKPLACSEADAAEMYAAAAAKGVMLQEGLWTRFFPAVEHARAVMEKGAIGDPVMVHADFPDQCYAVQAAPMAFGTGERPTEVVASVGRTNIGGVLVQYGGRGCASLTFPPWDCEYPEVIEIIGTKGRITLDIWGHHPLRVTVRTTPPELLAMGPGAHTSTSQNNVFPIKEQAIYQIPSPSGMPAPGWNFSNQRGFIYQAQAVHRCLAAGLLQCPQFTREESLQVMYILDQVQAAAARRR